ncbi:MAG: hydroxyethylthiazole kinase [Deltaproteobacteria bacterium]|nr:MAG: hydroxyethylthiazole kinase [Deltaproteobacteria bacterium]
MVAYDLKSLLEKVRKERPLVHNITNFVVMNFTANTLLAMGASPVMAHAVDEVEEMVSFARAFVINIGTLSEPWIEAMFKGGRKANELGIPIVLDPVGSGATSLRTTTFRKLIKELNLAVVRGNASEILSVASDEIRTKGVDAAHDAGQALETARSVAKEIGSVAAITGRIDLITDGDTVIRCNNGHPLLGRVTGTGCAATTTIAAFAGVTDDRLEATSAGLAFFGLAGELAAARANSPGSFMVSLVDALYEISPQEFQARARLEEA